MTRIAAILVLLASPALADPVAVIGTHPLHTQKTATHVHLHEPTDPAAVATLSCHNRGVNGPSDSGTYRVEWQGIAVTVEYEWNADDTQSDRITVEAPEGYAAVPRTLDLGEEQRGQVQIIKWEGM